MSKYSEMVALLEYVDSKNKKTKTNRFRKEPEPDLFQLLLKKKQDAKLLEEFLKEQEKIHKKEEKTGFDKLTVVQRTLIFSIFGPPVGLGYMFLMLYMFRIAAQVLGVKP